MSPIQNQMIFQVKISPLKYLKIFKRNKECISKRSLIQKLQELNHIYLLKKTQMSKNVLHIV